MSSSSGLHGVEAVEQHCDGIASASGAASRRRGTTAPGAVGPDLIGRVEHRPVEPGQREVFVPITAKQALYIKLGRGGDWEPECLRDGILRLCHVNSLRCGGSK